MRRGSVQIPSPSEIETFSSTSDAQQTQAAKTVAEWDELTKSTTYFYMPVEHDSDEPTKPGFIYMEAPRESEPWLGGVVVAFRSELELQRYIQIVCERRGNNENNFTGWKANLDLLCRSMPEISRRWREETPDAGGIRVELCKATQDGIIEYVDTLWDNTTT